MPINMQIEYPKLEAENIKLKMINDSLLSALKDVISYTKNDFGYKQPEENKLLWLKSRLTSIEKAHEAIKEAEQQF